MKYNISIVSPSFNQTEWLKLAIRSVRDQTYTQLGGRNIKVQHIVQDSCTPRLKSDLSCETAIYDKNCSLEISSAKDNSMYEAINRGLEKSEGDICGLLNCDEQYLPDTFDKVTNFFSKNPEIEVLFGDVIIVNKRGEALSYRRIIKPTLLHTKYSTLGTLSCATFFRRSIIERSLKFNEDFRAVADAVWIQTLIENRVRMKAYPYPLAAFTYTGMNLSIRQNSSSGERSIRIPSNLKARALGAISSCIFRVRKLAAGAYRYRDLSYEIFTHQTPEVRTKFMTRNLGFQWPDPYEIN